MWEVEVTDEFVDWWSTLSIQQQEAITDRVDVLSEKAPILAGQSWTESTGRGINR